MVDCPYCQAPAYLASGAHVYPHRPDLRRLPFWRCDPCDAHVGCHPDTTHPMGSLANAELRAKRRAAHASFDPIWQTGLLSRGKAYQWLRREMRLSFEDCHIGRFTVEQCAEAVEICSHYPHSRPAHV